MSEDCQFSTSLFNVISRISTKKSLGLVLTGFIILFSVFHVNSASAVMTSEFKGKCRWTTSDGISFSHPDCNIRYGFVGVDPCPSRKIRWGVFYGVAFPNGPSVEILVQCPNYSRNDYLIYDVDGRPAFNCAEKTEGYNHSICFSTGEKIEFYVFEMCC